MSPHVVSRSRNSRNAKDASAIDPALNESGFDVKVMNQTDASLDSSDPRNTTFSPVDRSTSSSSGSKSELTAGHRSSVSSHRRPSVMSKASSLSAEQEEDNPALDEMQLDDFSTDPKERSREKNKVAAAKCRAKKRENMDMIETNHRTLSAENSYLRRHEQQLRATVAQLRTLALDHQHCNCGVHQYNIIQAGHLARGIGGLHMQHFGGMGACQGPGPEGGDSKSPESAENLHDPSAMSPMFQDMGQMGMSVDGNNMLDMQGALDPFFYDFHGSSDYSHDT